MKQLRGRPKLEGVHVQFKIPTAELSKLDKVAQKMSTSRTSVLVNILREHFAAKPKSSAV
jgi:hypothetical protein